MSPLRARLVDLPASARALAIARIGVYATCAVMLLRTNLPMMATLPMEWFQRLGLLLLLPESAVPTLLSPTTLWLVHGLACGLGAALMLGVRPFQPLAWGFVAVLLIHEGISKGFGAYVNHAQLALIYTTVVLAMFPCADELSVCGPRRADRMPALYSAPMAIVPVVIGLTYAAIGLRRLTSGGVGIYFDDTIVTFVIARSHEYSAFGNTVGLMLVEWGPLRGLLRIGYFMTTVAEIAAPLVIVMGWRLRLVWLGVIVPFHLFTLLTMNILFWENLVLILIFCTGLPHWLAGRNGAPQRATE